MTDIYNKLSHPVRKTSTANSHKSSAQEHAYARRPASTALLVDPHSLRHALPGLADTQSICQFAGRISVYFCQMLFTSYDSLHFEHHEPLGIVKDLHRSTDTKFVLKNMLLLAIYLQTLSIQDQENSVFLFESPESIMGRLEETLSTALSDDKLWTSVQGLECIVLRAVYLANRGSLKPALNMLRRVLAAAPGVLAYESQSVGGSPISHEGFRFLWFRINYMQRILCLSLGLPLSLQERNPEESSVIGTGQHPMEVLERRHSEIITQIINRNRSKASLLDPVLTQEIDANLRNAARSLPASWWLQPDLKDSGINGEILFMQSLRLTNQLLHHYLVTQLHLPQMLFGELERNRRASMVVCANSSREVLLRFNILSNSARVVPCCYVASSFALLTATTLLLAHINSHCYPETRTSLAHQRLADIGLVEQAMVSIDRMSSILGDSHGERIRNTRQLLRIEEEIESLTFTHPLNRVQGIPSAFAGQVEDQPVLSLQEPSLGVLTIMSSGKILGEPIHRQSAKVQRQPEALHGPSFTDLDFGSSLSPAKLQRDCGIGQGISQQTMDLVNLDVPVNFQEEIRETLDSCLLEQHTEFSFNW